MKRFLFLLLLVPVLAFTESMFSPSWGFFINLPEGYEYIDGDGKDRFSFSGPGGAMFDMIIYDGIYENIRDLVSDVNKRIGNRGDFDFFDYHGKQAALLKLEFGDEDGWGFCVELSSDKKNPPMLLALAYGPASLPEIELLHISALDSISPSVAERKYPGPVIEYSYPRGDIGSVLINGGINALIRENDAEAAQVLIEREFQILQMYLNTQYLQKAWERYYKLIYRDSWDRVTNAVSVLVNNLGRISSTGGAFSGKDDMIFAQKALSYIHNFSYDRSSDGSDFFNLVTVITEGRGSCDSYSMLWAIILAHADIRSGIMVSPQYNHAMGLADIEGAGARFEAYGVKWLVAETTDKINIGLIDQDMSDPAYWFSVIFD
jgi:hypothetical protein